MNSENAIKAYEAVVRWGGAYISIPPGSTKNVWGSLPLGVHHFREHAEGIRTLDPLLAKPPESFAHYALSRVGTYPYQQGPGQQPARELSVRCRTASYITSAAATEALREVMCPFIGMETIWSHRSFTKRDRPLPSAPMTSATDWW